jgi:type II secretory pathway pseudopilin PulG
MTRKQFETAAFTVIAVAFLFCILAVILGAQQAPASLYQPTADQAKDLRIAQLTRQNAQYQYALAQQQLQSAFAAEQAEGKKIHDQNKWPETVEYDINTGQYADHPKSDDKGEKK